MVVKTLLPPFFCLDIFFKYAMYERACLYLFYRHEFDDLLQMIRFEYNENKQRCD
jgi:hypothetical protein